MARQPMLKPDPTRYPRLVHTRIKGPEWVEQDLRENAADLNDMSFPQQEELPADVVLDLRLHEILEQAIEATGANGAVIALASGDKMVCRASFGASAPAPGVCLDAQTGLSGTCVQSREPQRCDDTLTDPRVNPAVCRDLDIRSILVTPVLGGEKLWGIFEIFSSVPHGFTDSDVEALQALSRRISHTVDEAIDEGIPEPVSDTFSSLTTANPPHTEIDGRDLSLTSGEQVGVMRHRDYGTSLLTAAVIALAILLGWMVGRAGWSMAVNRTQTQIPASPEQVQPEARKAPDTVAAASSTSAEAPTVSAKQIRPAAAPPPASRPTPKPKTEVAETAGGLVVYEQGKVVFRIPASQSDKTSRSDIDTATLKIAAGPEIGSPSDSSIPGANDYLLERVDPEYPEEARQQHIQGAVVLNVLVGRDGAVQDLKVISGDPQLIKAASDAVRQWRFQPHHLKGRPVEFETRITVNFSLP